MELVKNGACTLYLGYASRCRCDSPPRRCASSLIIFPSTREHYCLQAPGRPRLFRRTALPPAAHLEPPCPFGFSSSLLTIDPGMFQMHFPFGTFMTGLISSEFCPGIRIHHTTYIMSNPQRCTTQNGAKFQCPAKLRPRTRSQKSMGPHTNEAEHQGPAAEWAILKCLLFSDGTNAPVPALKGQISNSPNRSIAKASTNTLCTTLSVPYEYEDSLPTSSTPSLSTLLLAPCWMRTLSPGRSLITHYLYERESRDTPPTPIRALSAGPPSSTDWSRQQRPFGETGSAPARPGASCTARWLEKPNHLGDSLCLGTKTSLEDPNREGPNSDRGGLGEHSIREAMFDEPPQLLVPRQARASEIRPTAVSTSNDLLTILPCRDLDCCVGAGFCNSACLMAPETRNASVGPRLPWFVSLSSYPLVSIHPRCSEPDKKPTECLSSCPILRAILVRFSAPSLSMTLVTTWRSRTHSPTYDELLAYYYDTHFSSPQKD
ncbi:uncharacterized protein CLUP02_08443 [Colletotrichum lupini]|uniref:Uncharacterized protein n=1 Tax=Colletotrichum lupini TaxID=145971 RepID=A0A9Q8STJ9_9PEZI|nr:uncharacterized protein CLUP02_08443 [Colletotrichum lupini]UQC82953.1 hypothetical protein CLUP02_08443 [Colletotrichum lupini]